MGPRNRSSGIDKVFSAILAIYFGALVVYIALHPEALQWDFRTYYHAAVAFGQGLDPYYLRNLSAVAPGDVGFPFIYPPMTLLAISPLTILPYDTAFLAFLVLKGITFVLLTQLWRRGFLHIGHSPTYYAFCLLAFAGATGADFIAGNISVFETFSLWLAFYFLLKDRLALFCLFVLLPGFFKVYPVAFLVMLAATQHRQRFVWLGLGVGVFAGVMALGYGLYPDLTRSFLKAMGELGGGGIQSPSTLALLQDAAKALSTHGIAVPQSLPSGLYVLSAFAILAVSVLVLRKAGRQPLQSLVYVACFVLPLVVPRFKDYSYMMVLLPSYAVVSRGLRKTGVLWPLLFLLVSPRVIIPFGWSTEAAWLFWRYYALLCALAVWAGSMVRLWSTGSLEGGETPHPAE